MHLLQTETRQQVNLQRSIASELDWVNSNAKGQQKKGKARLRRYEDLTQQVWHLLSCPPLAPRLLQSCLLPSWLMSSGCLSVFCALTLVCVSRLTPLNRSSQHGYKGGTVDAFMAGGSIVTECCVMQTFMQYHHLSFHPKAYTFLYTNYKSNCLPQ